jgi:hypothetical protein
MHGGDMENLIRLELPETAVQLSRINEIQLSVDKVGTVDPVRKARAASKTKDLTA